LNKKIYIPQKTKGLIFDCDGTLVDSMPLHMQAWKQAFIQVGKEYDHELLYSLKGMKETDVIVLYNEHHKTKLDPGEMVRIKHEYLSKELTHVKPIPIVVDIVTKYYGKKPLAVVSGSPLKIVKPELQTVGIFELFATILTADDPFKPKPAPDKFLEAAKRIGIKPEYCQVFEDGDPGIIAAQKAGMLATDIRDYL
jgi:HAD superfamily hydrolase (TIGR01509 family)